MATEYIGLRLFVISIAPVMLVEVLQSLVFPGNPGLAALGAIRVIEILLISFPFVIREKNLVSLGISKKTILPGIRKGMIWSLAFGIITGIGFCILIVLKQNPLMMIRTRIPEQPVDILLFFFVGGIIAPIAEEFFFRGVLYGFFRRWGALFAVISSSLIFAMAHPKTSIIQITGGIVFAVSYEKERNLLVPVTIHNLGNLSLFSLSLLS
jgi:hypothetical protein